MINPTNQKPTISILGCGWYGLALAKKLVASGYSVKGSTTSEKKLPILQAAGVEPYLVDFDLEKSLYNPLFFESELLIVSIPPKRSSPSLVDYPAKIKAIALAAAQGNIRQLIFISSTGVYGDGNSTINEDIIPKPTSDSGKMMYEAEKLLKKELSFTTTVIRFGGLIGPHRNLAKHFAGKMNIPNGLAPVNLIHLSDCIGITQEIMEQKAFGHIYHAVTPSHPTRKDFYTAACLSSGFEKPEFSNELLDWKQVESKNVPEGLDYQYRISDWMTYARKMD